MSAWGMWHHAAPPNAFCTCSLGMAGAQGSLPSSLLKPERAAAFNPRLAMALLQELSSPPAQKGGPSSLPAGPSQPWGYGSGGGCEP